MKNYPYDIDKAKELLAKSSAPKGFDVTILIPSEDQTKAQMMAVVKQLWAQIGVNVTIQTMETNALFTKYMNGDYEASDPLPSITVRRARARRAGARVARPEGRAEGLLVVLQEPARRGR